jgi:hypothetical protein
MSWIEIVDGTGQVLARRIAEAVPCTIGSALDNTLVVNSPLVSPYHARIDRETDGTLTVTVLGHSSGLHRIGAPELSPILALTATAPVALADVIVRLVATSTIPAPVAAPPAVVEAAPASDGWRAIIGRAAVQWGAVVLLTLLGAALGYFTLPGKDRGLNALILALALLLGECMWVGVWALVGRLKHGRARFGSHFVVATGIALLGWIAGAMESWQQFLFPGADLLALLLLGVSAAVWVLAFYAHLRVMNRGNRESHRRIAVTAGVAALALLVTARNYKRDWSNDVSFSAVLKPFAAKLVPARPAAEYGKSLDQLETELKGEDAPEAGAPVEEESPGAKPKTEPGDSPKEGPKKEPST